MDDVGNDGMILQWITQWALGYSARVHEIVGNA